MTAVPQATTTRDLLDRYAGVLLDLYGVLVDAAGLLPDAPGLLAELERRKKPYAFVTNDASRSVETYVARFASWGVTVAPKRFVTSGSLLPEYKPLRGRRVAVLGTRDSEDYVRQAGGEVIPVERGMTIDAVAVCDDAGFAFLDGLEFTLSAIVRAVETGDRPVLVLPNPDLIYPKGPGELGFTAGTMALMIEAALERRFPGANLVFDHLGKPQPHLFRAGAARLGLPIDDVVMIGDQIETDIAGANAAGCPSALLSGEISRWLPGRKVAPTWLVDRLWP